MTPVTLTEPLFARLANAVWGFSRRYWRLVVVAMLALLHVAVFRGVADTWARALLLAHLGMLLLWQPFVRAEQRVSPTQGIVLSLVAVSVMLYLDWWLLAFWVVVIAGLVGGKVYQHDAPWQRRCYLVVLAYLLALLAVAILPEIAPRREIAPEIRSSAEYLLPLAFVLIALFPAESEPPAAAQAIDFFYSVFLMLLLVVVVLGSFTLMTLTGRPYLEALTGTVFLTAGAVLLIGLTWNPRSGGGLSVFFARYLFSIGLPVEQWLHVLAGLSHAEASPERFLAQAVGALERLPLVAGVSWRAGEKQAEAGTRTPHAVEYANRELALSIYSRSRVGPALQWHLQLLGQLLGEFYVAKLREEKLRETSYLQAVHEDRRAHHARHQESAAVAQRAVLGGGARGGRRRGAAAVAGAPPAAGHRPAPVGYARAPAAAAARGGKRHRRARLVGGHGAPIPGRGRGLPGGRARRARAPAAPAVRQRGGQPDPQCAGQACRAARGPHPCHARRRRAARAAGARQRQRRA